MQGTRRLLTFAGLGGLGAALLLSTINGSFVATSERVEEHVQLAALPSPLTLNQIFPWAVGPSAGAVAVSALGGTDPFVAAASGVLQSANQFGPLAFDLDSIRAASVNQTVPGTNNTVANVTNLDQWLLGMAGVGSSTGVVGFTEGAAQYDPYMANHAGVLQTSNQLGPAVFDLNVLKAIGFFQAPSGTVLASGYPDNVSAVDIGRWSAGIPGVVMNSGTTGFVDFADMGPGPVQASATGGLHTTTQIGSTTFDVNVLPNVSGGVMPYGFSVSMAPDLTAAETPFAPNDPPPPGVIVPPAISTPLVAAEEPPAVTTRLAETPKEAIPGVNGAPLAKPPRTGPAGAPGGANPFAPPKPLSDMIRNGINAVTGVKPSTGPADGPDGGGEGGNDGE